MVMPRIIVFHGYGKHCHSCGTWMPRRALRKESTCPSCHQLIIARQHLHCYASRCIECDAVVLDLFMFCELCGLETANGLKRQQKIKKAKELSAKAKKKPVSQQSQQTSQEELDCSIFSEDSFLEEFSVCETALPINEDLNKQQDIVAAAIKQAEINEDPNKQQDTVAATMEQSKLNEDPKQQDAMEPVTKQVLLEDFSYFDRYLNYQKLIHDLPRW